MCPLKLQLIGRGRHRLGRAAAAVAAAGAAAGSDGLLLSTGTGG